MSYSQNWRPGETFFSPMGSGVGAVFPTLPPGGTAATLPPPPLVSNAAGTPSKLVAQELYWRWFQLADMGTHQPPAMCHASARSRAVTSLVLRVCTE